MLSGLLVLVGCSRFDSEEDELAYLRRLSNPTPAQWSRQKELERKKETEQAQRALERMEREEAERKLAAEKAFNEQRSRVRDLDRKAVEDWIALAKEWDKAGDKAKADDARAKAEALRKGLNP
jgi:hypothetical protein